MHRGIWAQEQAEGFLLVIACHKAWLLLGSFSACATRIFSCLYG